MSLASLRLRNKAFKKYARDEYDGDDPLPHAGTYACWGLSSSNLVLRGYNADANEALSTANSGGEPQLEIPWCALDSFMVIMQRVEAKIKVPKKHWFLAADGEIFEEQALACNSVVFRKPNPELILLPKSAVDEHKTSQKPSTQSSVDLAKALFGIMPSPEAADGAAWAAYVKQRQRSNEELAAQIPIGTDEPDDDDYEDGPESETALAYAMLSHIRSGTSEVLASNHDVDDAVYFEAEKCVTPWSVDVQGDGDVTSADVCARIHSMVRPAAVDVKLFHWNKPRYYSVEWVVRILYRVLDPVPSDAPRDRDGDSGWKPLLSCELEDTNTRGDMRRWNPREVKSFGMLGADVRAIQRILLGDPQSAPEQHLKVSLASTIRLMLASVGIFVKLRVADEAYAPDPEVADPRGNVDRYAWFNYAPEYSLPGAEWLAVNIRRVCTVAIPSDADFVDKAAEPRYSDEEDEDEDSDRMDDDDDYY